jgi:hypothetical protein
MIENKEKTLNFDLPPELYFQITSESTRLGISTAGFMRMLAVQYFEKREIDSNDLRFKGGDK